MCGVSGFVLGRASLPGEELQGLARRMGDSLRHRGPDDSGAWGDETAGVAFGHRRLSVIDLSPHGRQPMASASGRYQIAYNGEVFNFAALRRELEPFGYAWRGHSDTEVLLAAIEQWGVPAAVGRLVGMFAFALWDRTGQELWLVRDRLGIKPLYYGWVAGSFVFASELRAFHAFPGFAADVDREALALFLRHSCVPGPLSIYRGTAKLMPGCLLRLAVRRPGGRLHAAPSVEAYWSVGETLDRARREPFEGDADEAASRLEALLTDAVGLRMVADVPLGAFLSGGLDSSLVTALMQAQSPRPVKTFTIASPTRQYDESGYATAVARHLGTEHRVLTVTDAEAIAVVPELAAIYDEPFGDSSQLPTVLVSRLARQEVTVALSGDGGDEVFGGYVRYLWGPRVWRLLRLLPPALRAVLARRLQGAAGRWLARGVETLPERMQFRLPDDKIKKLAEIMTARSFRDVYEGLVAWRPEDVPGVCAAEAVAVPWTADGRWPGDAAPWEQMVCADLQGYLPDDILVKVDRASMSVGLEARVPLLDHRVVEFALALPERFRLRGRTGKWLLRQVARRHLPAALLERPKMGFAVPLAPWLRGSLRGWAEEFLDERRLREGGYLDAGKVGSLWREHQSGRTDRGGVLWNVLMFQAWLQHAKKGVPAACRRDHL